MKSELNDGGPAFPCTVAPRTAQDVREAADLLGIGLTTAQAMMSHHPGMSLRDYFAGLAMQALIARGAEFTAVIAYTAADNLIKARDNEVP